MDPAPSSPVDERPRPHAPRHLSLSGDAGAADALRSLIEPRAARRIPRWVALLATVVVAGGVAWWFIRPADPPVDVTLPRASASPSSTTDAATDASRSAGEERDGDGPSSGGPASEAIIVHVAGAVVAPGLVTLGSGARLADAVVAAGGARPDADVDRVNLATPLDDGSRVYVPALGEETQPAVVDPEGPVGAAAGESPSARSPLDLNAATEAQLDQLPGIGPSTASAIVSHRAANGPFASVDQLEEVRGIGPAKLEQLRPLVAVGG